MNREKKTINDGNNNNRPCHHYDDDHHVGGGENWKKKFPEKKNFGNFSSFNVHHRLSLLSNASSSSSSILDSGNPDHFFFGLNHRNSSASCLDHHHHFSCHCRANLPKTTTTTKLTGENSKQANKQFAGISFLKPKINWIRKTKLTKPTRPDNFLFPPNDDIKIINYFLTFFKKKISMLFPFGKRIIAVAADQKTTLIIHWLSTTTTTIIFTMCQRMNPLF